MKSYRITATADRQRGRRQQSRRRPGVAVVEFAVCLPVLVILILGSIECTSMIFVNQSLNIVAYEGARAAIKSDATAVDTLARCNEVIAERRLAGCTVTLEPGNIEDLDRSTPITVRATAPVNSNSVLGVLRFFSGDLVGEAVMFKE